MKLSDQVLSIEQIQELQELGFTIEKYASMCWLAYNSDIPPYNKEYNLSTHDIYCYESTSLEPIPTLSIGDIIWLLPDKTEEDYNLEINKNNEEIKEKLIDALFEILKWYIKNNQVTEVNFLPPL